MYVGKLFFNILLHALYHNMKFNNLINKRLLGIVLQEIFQVKLSWEKSELKFKQDKRICYHIIWTVIIQSILVTRYKGTFKCQYAPLIFFFELPDNILFTAKGASSPEFNIAEVSEPRTHHK